MSGSTARTTTETVIHRIHVYVRISLVLACVASVVVACEDEPELGDSMPAAAQSAASADEQHPLLHDFEVPPGIRLVYEVTADAPTDVVPAERVQEVFEERLGHLEIKHRTRIVDDTHVAVVLPDLDAEDVDAVEGVLGTSGRLRIHPVDEAETRRVGERLAENDNLKPYLVLHPYSTSFISHDAERVATFEATVERLDLDLPPERVLLLEPPEPGPDGEIQRSIWVVRTDKGLDPADVVDSRIQDGELRTGGPDGEPRPAVRVELSEPHAERFHELTKAYIRRPIAIMLDDEILMVPVVREPIPGPGISVDVGGTDPQEMLRAALELHVVIRSVALAAPVELVSKTAIGPAQ